MSGRHCGVVTKKRNGANHVGYYSGHCEMPKGRDRRRIWTDCVLDCDRDAGEP
jgi:hypothetical protein